MKNVLLLSVFFSCFVFYGPLHSAKFTFALSCHLVVGFVVSLVFHNDDKVQISKFKVNFQTWNKL